MEGCNLKNYDFEIPSALKSTSEINKFLETETNIVDKIDSDEILARAFAVIIYINHLSQNERVGILEKLIKYLKKLKKKLDKIGKEWGVKKYSLGVGFTGIDLTLEFEP